MKYIKWKMVDYFRYLNRYRKILVHKIIRNFKMYINIKSKLYNTLILLFYSFKTEIQDVYPFYKQIKRDIKTIKLNYYYYYVPF